MKNVLAIMAVSTVTLSSFASEAHPRTQTYQLFKDLQNLGQKCLTLPFVMKNDGEKEFSPVQNHCDQIQIINDFEAFVTIGQHKYKVVIKESEDSDGGDLDDVFVYGEDCNSLIAQRHNVLAFNNVLIAISGNENNIPQVELK